MTFQTNTVVGFNKPWLNVWLSSMKKVKGSSYLTPYSKINSSLLAQLVEHVTLDLEVVSLSPMVQGGGVEIS